jgi:hypothetical protein
VTAIADLRSQPRLEVSIAPQRYNAAAMNLNQMMRVIAVSTVKGRGWSFPYAEENSIIVGPGMKYIGGELDFTTFVSHLEEWRLYSSGQFLFRMRPWEIPDQEWQRKTRERLESRERRVPPDVIGFLAFDLLLFSVTEAYIFASRLAEAVPYDTAVNVHVGLKGVKGYALASREPDRALYQPYTSPIDNPHDDVTLPLDVLIANPKAAASSALINLYRQFRWTNPPAPETIAQHQIEYYR